jgi:TIR domain
VQDFFRPLAPLKPTEFDVFVSYAHADNGVPLGARFEQGWVTALTSNLNVGPNVLAKRFFVDHQLRPGDDFGTDLLLKVEHSSLLLLILSENYIESRWCGQELEHFTRTHASDVENPRDVFMVELAPYESFSTVPNSIQLLRRRLISVKFWYQLSDTSAPSLAGYPSPLDSGPVGRDQYWKALNDLRGAMDRRLRELRAGRP